MAFNEISDPFRRLVRIMERLQEPGGCPWDLEQTHESLKPYMIEEAYEALDAIDRGDYRDLEEELGDVLLQVVFHSVLANRFGRFHVDQVIETAAAKMVRRHPHVFGEADADSAAEVLRNWEQLKAREREAKGRAGEEPPASALAGVPPNLPALLRAQRMQEKAANMGFDWESVDGAIAKVEEEMHELRTALARGDRSHAAEELGDLIFALAKVGRFLGIDAEDAVRQTCDKFRGRFEAVENHARATGRTLKEMTLGEMMDVWNAAKGPGTGEDAG